MQDIYGLEVQMPNFRKVVGKVCVCPNENIAGHLVGRRILYRVINWSKLYHRNTKAVTVDCALWQTARRLGAEAMIIWCPDERKLIRLSKKEIESSRIKTQKNAPSHYHIDAERGDKVYPVYQGLNIGAPTQVVPCTLDRAHGAARYEQPTLFQM